MSYRLTYLTWSNKLATETVEAESPVEARKKLFSGPNGINVMTVLITQEVKDTTR